MASSYYFNCVTKEAIMLMNIGVQNKLQIQLFMSRSSRKDSIWHALCISLQWKQVGGRRLFLLFDNMVENEFNNKEEFHFATMH